jgi:hypothetical protein
MGARPVPGVVVRGGVPPPAPTRRAKLSFVVGARTARPFVARIDRVVALDELPQACPSGDASCWGEVAARVGV